MMSLKVVRKLKVMKIIINYANKITIMAKLHYVNCLYFIFMNYFEVTENISQQGESTIDKKCGNMNSSEGTNNNETKEAKGKKYIFA